jgi:cysteine desulfuration protein SufE
VSSELPPKLQGIVDLFASAPRDLRLQALLDYSRRVPEPPRHLIGSGAFQDVPECQTPFALAIEVDPDGAVHLHFDAPAEAPTVRGYAGILREGLEGATAEEIRRVPLDFYMDMGLVELVTPLRLRGMEAILARIKSRLSEDA